MVKSWFKPSLFSYIMTNLANMKAPPTQGPRGAWWHVLDHPERFKVLHFVQVQVFYSRLPPCKFVGNHVLMSTIF